MILEKYLGILSSFIEDLKNLCHLKNLLYLCDFVIPASFTKQKMLIILESIKFSNKNLIPAKSGSCLSSPNIKMYVLGDGH